MSQDTFLSNTHAGSRPLAGIGLLVIATFTFAVQDAITKQLTHLVPVSQIVATRFFAFSILAIIIAHFSLGLKVAIHSAFPLRQTVRVLIMCFEIGLFAYGIRFLGLAEMHAILACFPLIVTALSVPMLGEAVGWRRWLAVGAGFIGTLIILSPGAGVFDVYALIPLACAFLYAVYNLMTRSLSRHDSFETSLLYFGLVGFIASIIVAVPQWQSMDPASAGMLLAICCTSVFSHLLLIKALEWTAAVILQPFNYLMLVWAILLGYVIFGETLDALELLGASIVVLSGIFIGYREYRLARA